MRRLSIVQFKLISTKLAKVSYICDIHRVKVNLMIIVFGSVQPHKHLFVTFPVVLLTEYR